MPAPSFAKIIALQKQIALHNAARKRARLRNDMATVASETRAINAIQLRIAALRRESDGGRSPRPPRPPRSQTRPPRSPRSPRPPRPGKPPRSPRPGKPPTRRPADPFQYVQITCDNCGKIWTHYDAVRNGAPGWKIRMVAARRLMRLCQLRGKGPVAAMLAKKREIRQLAQHQRDRAASLRKKGRANDAAEADRLADRYEEQHRVIAATEKLPPEPVDASTAIRTPSDAAGRGADGELPDGEDGSEDGDGASVSASASVDKDGIEASADLNLPWYRRYWLPLAVLAALGLGVAVSKKGKGGFLGKGMPGGASGSRLSVSRMSFTAKRPHRADTSRAAK